MAPKVRRTARRNCRKRSSYVESSSGSNNSSDTDGEDSFTQNSDSDRPSAPPAKVPRRGRPPRTRSKPATSRPKAKSSPRKVSRKATTHTSVAAPPPIPSDGVIPNWTLLPYEIIVSIFRYASFPRFSHGYTATNQTCWLALSLRICKAFVEPVVTVLYESPALRPVSADPYQLLETLRRAEAGNAAFDYRRKVKTLKLNAADALKYTVPGRGRFQLEDLLPHVPLLTELDIAVDSDFPPFRARRASEYSLPWSLIQVLMDGPIKLRGWRWNGSMTSVFNPTMVKEVHESKAMSGLRRLYISNIAFVWPINGTKEERRACNAELMAPLTELEDLTLCSCTNEDWTNMCTYPSTLKSLTLLNCDNFRSEHLIEFLNSNGSQLRSLVLNHNNALDLSFITGLRTWCPRLENLEMDLTYFSSLLVTYEDTQPDFVRLLGDDEKPTWPSSLQRVQLLNLRKWSLDAARNLFSSFVESSKDLVNLRSLEIKAILNIAWRDRAGFRDHWISRLNKVFLSRSRPPSSHLVSMKAFREWKRTNSLQSNTLPLRTGPKLNGSGPAIVEESQSDRHRQSSRLKDKEEAAVEASRQQRRKPAEPETDDHIQGACTHVDINIDNQRPRETTFKETDFMDDEISGDEEWTGDQFEESGYAW